MTHHTVSLLDQERRSSECDALPTAVLSHLTIFRFANLNRKDPDPKQHFNQSLEILTHEVTPGRLSGYPSLASFGFVYLLPVTNSDSEKREETTRDAFASTTRI